MGFLQKLPPPVAALGLMLVLVGVTVIVPRLVSEAEHSSQPINRTIKQKAQQCEGCRLELTPEAFLIGESADEVDRRLRDAGFSRSDVEGTYVHPKADDAGFGCDRNYFAHIQFDKASRQLISAFGSVGDTCL